MEKTEGQWLEVCLGLMMQVDNINLNIIMTTKGRLKTCKKGHQFYKSSDCPTCPVCEEERKPKDSFLALIGSPARRALERENIKTSGGKNKFARFKLAKISFSPAL